MEVIDEVTAFRKLKKKAEYNDIVCVEDLFSSYKIQLQENTQEQVSTKEFINHHFPDREFILKEKKFDLVSTNNIIKKTKQMLDTKVKTEKYIYDLLKKDQKHYLINQDIEARIILNPYTFLQKLHEEIKEEAIRELKEETEKIKFDFPPSQIYKQQHEIKFAATKVLSDFQKRKNEFFYRGQSSINYSLLPSIYRNGFEKHESQMNDQLISTSNQDFLNIHRHVDVLRKMQHYGMPTRLIDITSNPLIGLYFAVSGSPHLDGEFIMFDLHEHNEIKTNNSDTVEILSALSAMDNNRKQELFKVSEEFSKKFSISNDNKDEVISNFNQTVHVKYLLHEIRSTVGDFEPIIDPRHLTQAFFVSTHIDNPRISNQNGSFIITSLCDDTEDIPLESPKNTIRISLEKYRAKHGKKVIRYIIPSALKEIIKIELANLGINDHHIYPDLEHAATYIKGQYTE